MRRIRLGWQTLRENKRSGVALVAALCASALLLGLALSLVYSSGVLLARSNRKLRRERCDQLARSLGTSLDAQLRAYTTDRTDVGAPAAAVAPSDSFYAYVSQFLDREEYAQYDPDNPTTTTYYYVADEDYGEDYGKLLDRAFSERWIDVYENRGKRTGAYSAGTKVHPYVLLNYTGSLDSEFTLAHEMGHALHSYLSNKHQNPIDSDYVIFVAEVASTCNEALLMEYLLKRTRDKKERAYLINYFLDQFKGTIYRQVMFAEFEKTMGEMVDGGQTLTADVLCAEYRRLAELYYGPDMEVDEEIAIEWARIPHFYYDYYVFQYATGYAAAIALSRRILSEGEPAVKDYLGFLSGGCSKSPIDLLKGAGVDMTGPQPVNDALALFGELLDEMESLME